MMVSRLASGILSLWSWYDFCSKTLCFAAQWQVLKQIVQQEHIWFLLAETQTSAINSHISPFFLKITQEVILATEDVLYTELLSTSQATFA